VTLGAGARRAARAAGIVVALLSIAALASACDGSSAPTPSPTDTLLAIEGAGAGGSDGSAGGEGAASSGEGSAPSSQLGAAGTCPVGRWVMDNQSWASALGELMRTEIPGADVTVTGDLWLDWNADGTYAITARSSEYVMTGSTDGSSFVQTISHDGVEAGTWVAVSASGYDLVAQDQSQMASAMSITAGGVTYAPDPSELAPEAWTGRLEVACGPEAMTTTATDDTGSLSVDVLPRG
jgi:hypothetical protein